MPKRTDIKSVLMIDVARLVIGQACEFDHSCGLLKRRTKTHKDTDNFLVT
jgi:hypothetical protein